MPQVKEIFRTMDYGPAPEANQDVIAWLAAKKDGFGHFIGGEFVPSKDGAAFDVFNPATGAKLAQVAQGGKAEIDAAVESARKAFGPWSALPGDTRARYLYALARLLQKRERFFSVLETMDNGKPIRESRDIDIPLVVRHYYHHAGWAELIESEFPNHKPVGVCGQIIPWNFPLLMLAWKVAPALAAGNTVVLKPAEFTPLTALAFAELCREAGLPAGVVNIVTGDGRTGALITEHPGIDKVAFTGSTEVGRIIRKATAGSGKKLSLELGGKSPFIVFDDADLDSAVEGIVDAIWFNQGQVCCAGSRLLVHEAVAERMHAKLKARLETLRVGDPLDKATDMGAIVDAVQLDRIRSLVEQGRTEGAACWQPSIAVPEKGLFFPPTLMTNVAPAATIAQEEIFGPVLVSMTFRTPDEAVQLANNSRYGLAASIWSESINVALDCAARLKAGVVWVNSTNLFDAAAGFGGYRESGFGREGGREGLYEYLAPAWEKKAEEPAPARKVDFSVTPAAETPAVVSGVPRFDRTAKLYIGGKQTRPDGGYSYTLYAANGAAVGQAGLGNRKDIRNAVEAAGKATSWSGVAGHNRAQVLYYVAENLEARTDEFTHRIASLVDGNEDAAREEVAASVRRLAFYAAHADKYDGQVHSTRSRHVTLAMNEPWGTMAICCPDEAPLLAFVSLVAPAIAMGNRVVVVPSPAHALVATDFYQVLDTSDVPGGVVNIVTGDRESLAKTIADHDDISAFWYFGTAEGSKEVEQRSTGNLKATWVNYGRAVRWADAQQGQGREFLRRATQVKNIWVPYGE
ncbi:aldehyde dehydrogenase family protein [Pseudaminobacter sp. 19-2017]|uniref:Aldehyde dehydrogenase family protein n=1 Tax=Pseudaminobacter soli (ex Zhang et al. 2022) TaxID=2831468 RepID=A0A942E0J8_9HYPH|nr:aldehyde dehydrogenase family protein [Pseudaminobacter soli]MBS3648390.1 aldehyde dehydrogenase family protein [Pseudaminobacter soli]